MGEEEGFVAAGRTRRGMEEIYGLLTIKNLVLPHAIWIPVSPEANHDESLFLRHDGLVDVPARHEMREDNGTHVLSGGFFAR